MAEADIFLERSDGFARLVFNRPDKRNAVTAAMWAAIPELLAQAEADPSINVLIVTGRGGSFAAGADIAEFETVYATPESAEQYSKSINRALDGLADFPKPTIARIEGACVGGGCGIALSCDLRIGLNGSKYGVTPAKLGLVYPLNDTRRLIEAVGVPNAKDILFTARHLDAEEAHEIGLINQWVDTVEDLDEMIANYIDTFSRVSPYSVRMAKQMIHKIGDGIVSETEESFQMFLDGFNSDDFQEGYRAFLEKRKPEFKT